MIEIEIEFTENGWTASGYPSEGTGLTFPVTDLPVNPKAVNLKSLVFFSSHNTSVDTQKKGAWVDDVLVQTDRLSPTQVEIGDVNRDGNVDLLDVAPFVDVLTGGAFQAECDTNQDGTVDLLDVGPFVDLLIGN